MNEQNVIPQTRYYEDVDKPVKPYFPFVTPLSASATNRLNLYKKFQKPVVRPSWDEFFMGKAFEISKRSHDAQTQHGCVIVRDKRELVSGYNGFVRGIDDSVLPNLRDETGEFSAKYPWMVHAEANAVANAAYEGVSLKDTTLYITCIPCGPCLNLVYQAGIKEIVYSSRYSKCIDNEEFKIFLEIFQYLTKGNMSFRQLSVSEM